MAYHTCRHCSGFKNQDDMVQTGIRTWVHINCALKRISKTDLIAKLSFPTRDNKKIEAFLELQPIVIKEELMNLHSAGQKLEGNGVILSGPTGYISGFPYLMSSDNSRAFRFANVAMAEELRGKYCLLREFKAVEMQS